MKTSSDAFQLVVQAKIGSLVDTSPDYLETLRLELLRWNEQVEAELHKLDLEKASRKEYEHECHMERDCTCTNEEPIPCPYALSRASR